MLRSHFKTFDLHVLCYLVDLRTCRALTDLTSYRGGAVFLMSSHSLPSLLYSIPSSPPRLPFTFLRLLNTPFPFNWRLYRYNPRKIFAIWYAFSAFWKQKQLWWADFCGRRCVKLKKRIYVFLRYLKKIFLFVLLHQVPSRTTDKSEPKNPNWRG